MMVDYNIKDIESVEEYVNCEVEIYKDAYDFINKYRIDENELVRIIYEKIKIFKANSNYHGVKIIDCRYLFKNLKNHLPETINIVIYLVRLNLKYRVLCTFDYDVMLDRYLLSIYTICQPDDYMKKSAKIYNYILTE